MTVRVNKLSSTAKPRKPASAKRPPKRPATRRKKGQSLISQLLKWPLRHWKPVLLLVLFLLGGFISNLDRGARYVSRLRGLKKFLPEPVAELIFPPEYLTFGLATQGEELFGTVTKVIDGDTFIMKSVGGREDSYKVRMWGIDAPESSQEFGTTSADALSDKILNRAIRLQVAATDRYSRQVCRVFGDNEEDINLYMVKNGYAWYYRDYADGAAYLEQAEAEARRNKRGLWTYPAPQPPWEYRKNNRD